jgi:hypothetical protein
MALLIAAALASCGGDSDAPAGEAGPRPRAAGPLDGGPRSHASVVVLEREIWNHGMIVLRNAGSAPATVNRVGLVGASPGLELVGAYLARVPRGGVGGGDIAWPPPPLRRADVRPLHRLPIRPESARGEQAVQLLLRLRPPRAHGRYGFESVRVAYRSGGRGYERVVPHALAICVAPSRAADCAPVE